MKTSRDRRLKIRILAASAAALLLSGSAGFANTITWTTGTGTTNWSVSGNWTGAATPPVSGDALVFGATTGTKTLTNDLTSAAFEISGITFNSGTPAYTIGGNAFTLTGGITNSGTALQTINDAITIGAVRTITSTAAASSVKLGGAISGSGGGLSFTGAGTLILGANGSTYDGGTVVNQGTLQLGDGSTTGSIPTGGSLTLAAGTTLAISRSDNLTQSTYTGAGTSFQSGLGGSVGFTKAGAGIFTVDVANSYSGATTVSAGFLRLTNASGLGTAGGANSVASGATLALSGGITVNGEDITITGTGVTTTSGEFAAAQRGALQSSAGNNTFGGNITIAAATTRIGAQDGASLTLNGNITGGSAGTGLIFREGPGSTITLNGTASNYLGNTMTFGGTLRNGVNNALPTGTTLITAASGVTSASIYDLNGFNQTIAGLATDASAGGSSTVTNNGAANSTLTFNGTTDRSYNGTITNGSTNSVALVKDGTFNQTLSGASTFTGAITVDGGTLTASAASANNGTSGPLGNVATAGRTFTINSGATLSLTSNNVFGNQTNAAANLPAIVVNGGTVNATFYNTIGALTLNGGTLTQTSTSSGNYAGYQLRGNVTVGGSAASTISTGNGKGTHLGTNTTFTVADATGDASADLTVSTPLINQSGDFSNAAGGFTKAGTGTMLLTASNTYTGPTKVTAGTLEVSGNIGGTTSVSVTGGTLLLSARSAVNSTAGVTLGDSVNSTQGTLKLAASLSSTTDTLASPTQSFGTLTLSYNSTLDFGTGSGDWLIFAGLGSHTSGTTLSILNWSGTAGTAGGATSDRLIFSGNDIGVFEGLFNQADVSFNGVSGYQAIQFGANQYEIVAVPEPSSATLLVSFGLAGLIGFRERRRLRRLICGMAAARE